MYPQRPSMHARDSSGRQVSLLNDEPSRSNDIQYHSLESSSYPPPDMIRSNSDTSTHSNASSPYTPGLVRAGSYDSQMTGDPHSPITPTDVIEFGRQGSYANTHVYKDQSHYDHQEFTMASSYTQQQQQQQQQQQPQYTMASRPSFDDNRHNSYSEPHNYNDEEFPAPKGAKRYPCRFRESHGCDRTFTTSGHASRHSKIHTAEKAVNCSHPGCQKKFTRADNMKQHLETHYKDRSRSNAGHKPSVSAAAGKSSALTVPAGVRKQSMHSSLNASSNANGRVSRNSISLTEHRPEQRPPMVDPALFDPHYMITSSSSSTTAAAASSTSPFGALSMTSVREALVSSPSMRSAPANGLDALAAAAADYQQIQA